MKSIHINMIWEKGNLLGTTLFVYETDILTKSIPFETSVLHQGQCILAMHKHKSCSHIFRSHKEIRFSVYIYTYTEKRSNFFLLIDSLKSSYEKKK